MIYLDNAATTLQKPQEVIEAVSYAITHFGNPERSLHEASLLATRTIYQTRKKVASLLCAKSSKQIVFTKNATESLNIAIKGLLKKSDHVITTVLEHNSVLRPLYELEAQGMQLSIVNCDEWGNLIYDEIESYIQENTKAIVCTHASNVTGNVVDLKRIKAIAEKYQLIWIVDASQSMGSIPIDVEDLGVDVLCFTGHKSLYGIQGTGGMYVKEDVKILPLLSGGSGIDSFSRKHPQEMPTALEAGTLNAHGLAGLSAGLDFIEKETLEKIHQKEMFLLKTFYEKVKKIKNVKVIGDFTSMHRCPILSMMVEGFDASWISDCLAQNYNIATRAGAHCAPLMHTAFKTGKKGLIRFSFSYFNTIEEVEFTIKALKEICE